MIKQWEYLTVSNLGEFEHWLEQHGKVGWELVTLYDGRAYFKRELITGWEIKS